MSTIPKRMFAWQKDFKASDVTKPYRVEVAVPSAPPDGVLVKVHAAGICHSDATLLAMTTPPPGYKEQYTLGHEGCGEIVQVGSDVSEFKVGDLVAIDPVNGCLKTECLECGSGFPQICVVNPAYGLGTADGSYAPYVAVLAKDIALVPSGVSAEHAAVATDACMTSYHAVFGTAQVKKGQTIFIHGVGGLGMNAVQMVLSTGARLIVTDLRQEPLDQAVAFGVAKEDVVPVGKSATEFVMERKLVIDTVLDFAGKLESFKSSQEFGTLTLSPCFNQLTELVRFGGKIVQVGLLAPTLEITNLLAVRKHLSILCTYGGRMDELKECLDLIAKGKLKPQTETRPMSEFGNAIEDLHAGKIKSRLVLVPSDSDLVS